MGTLSKAHFQQEISKRNDALRDMVESLYISQAKSILSRPPFCYSEKISKEVSEGIVRHGDKLLSNATLDSEDEDDETDELNELGDEYQNMVNSTLLQLNINPKDESTDHIPPTFRLYPQPNDTENTESAEAPVLGKALQEMKRFIEGRASQGFAAAIMLEGDCTEDGVSFGGQLVVPVDIIQAQVQKLLNTRGLNICPMAVDLVMKHHDKGVEGLRVVSIKDKSIDNFVITQA